MQKDAIKDVSGEIGSSPPDPSPKGLCICVSLEHQLHCGVLGVVARCLLSGAPAPGLALSPSSHLVVARIREVEGKVSCEARGTQDKLSLSQLWSLKQKKSGGDVFLSPGQLETALGQTV